MIPKRDFTIIVLSLKVLNEALDRTKAGKIDTTEVRLALRCLLPHVADDWPLRQFWDGAQVEQELGRAQSCNASLNGIVLQLKANGIKVE